MAVTVARKTVRLHRAQYDFCHSTSLYRGFIGGRGSGKSFVACYDLIRRAKRGRTYQVIGPTYTNLLDSTLRSFVKVARDLGVIDPSRIKRSPPPALTLTTGAEILFRSADEPEKLRGGNISGCVMDEASLMGREAYDITIASLREGAEQGWLSAAMTPKGLSHWSYDIWGKQAPNTALFHARTKDNPFLPPDFHHTLSLQYSGLRAQQELDGLFVSMDGVEWPSNYFDDSLWFTAWPTSFVARALALDPSKGRDASKPKEGREPDYSAYCWGGVDAEGVVWVDADLDNVRDTTRMVEDGIGIFRQFQPHAVLVEINQFQELIGGEFLRQGREQRLDIPLYGCNNTEPKPVRIRGVGPYLAKRELRFRDTPGCRLLVQQCRDFPCGKFDDGPDALSMLLRMLVYLILGHQEGQGQPRLLKG